MKKIFLSFILYGLAAQALYAEEANPAQIPTSTNSIAIDTSTTPAVRLAPKLSPAESKIIHFLSIIASILKTVLSPIIANPLFVTALALSIIIFGTLFLVSGVILIITITVCIWMLTTSIENIFLLGNPKDHAIFGLPVILACFLGLGIAITNFIYVPAAGIGLDAGFSFIFSKLPFLKTLQAMLGVFDQNKNIGRFLYGKIVPIIKTIIAKIKATLTHPTITCDPLTIQRLNQLTHQN